MRMSPRPASPNRRAGIPVISYNADVSPGTKNNRMAYVGQNNLTAGAAIGAEIGFIQYVGKYGVPSESFWVDFFAGGFGGLLVVCVVLRMIYSMKRMSASKPR